VNVRGAAAFSTSLLLAGALAKAQPPSPLTEGVITQVTLSGSPRTLRVKVSGREILVEITDRTLVVFEGSAATVSTPAHVSSLTPGMTVRLAEGPEGLERIHVIGVPESLRTETKKKSEEALPAVRTVKARLRDLRYDTSSRRGEVRAEVAGKSERYFSGDPSLFRGFRRGDVVLIGLARDGSLVSIEKARLHGRVKRVDARRGEVTVEIDGKSEEFAVANESLLDRVRAGDLIQFDVEERSRGRRVITAVY
jgi:hypothetical protein